MRSAGQGATEYLVLLAVVLVIALVAIALLGFFPGTAMDTQLQESQLYYQSASPIAIVEWGARDNAGYGGGICTDAYWRVRNTGPYPIRITKVLANGNESVSQVYVGGGNSMNISDLFYLAPGAEGYFSDAFFKVPERSFCIFVGPGYGQVTLTPKSVCNALNASSPGVLQLNGFGFEYVQYIEGQQIVKREIGAKPMMIKCTQ